MLDIGQPLHAFDADAIATKKLVACTAKQGTPLTLLDGQTIELSSDDLVISNGVKPLALAGTWGGVPLEYLAKLDLLCDALQAGMVEHRALALVAVLAGDIMKQSPVRDVPGVSCGLVRGIQVDDRRPHRGGDVHGSGIVRQQYCPRATTAANSASASRPAAEIEGMATRRLNVRHQLAFRRVAGEHDAEAAIFNQLALLGKQFGGVPPRGRRNAGMDQQPAAGACIPRPRSTRRRDCRPPRHLQSVANAFHHFTRSL